MLEPEAQSVFFKANDDMLTQQEVYDFMKPVFGPEVVYDVADARSGEPLCSPADMKRLVKDVVFGGDGSEEDPFLFKVVFKYYVYFRAVMKHSSEWTTDQSYDVAIEMGNLETMTLYLFRQVLRQVGFVATCRHYQKPSGLVWSREEESTANLLLSTVMNEGYGTSRCPFRINLVLYHFYRCEWMNGVVRVRNQVMVGALRTEGFTLSDLREMLRGDVPPFVFVNGFTQEDVDRNSESSTVVVDIVKCRHRFEGNLGAPFCVALRRTTSN